MAAGAFRHDLVEIVFSGIVGMKDLVAELAVEAVLAALVFEVLVMGHMASRAIGYGQGLGSNVEDVGWSSGFHRDRGGRFGNSCCGIVSLMHPCARGGSQGNACGKEHINKVI